MSEVPVTSSLRDLAGNLFLLSSFVGKVISKSRNIQGGTSMQVYFLLCNILLYSTTHFMWIRCVHRVYNAVAIVQYSYIF